MLRPATRLRLPSFSDVMPDEEVQRTSRSVVLAFVVGLALMSVLIGVLTWR